MRRTLLVVGLAGSLAACGGVVTTGLGTGSSSGGGGESASASASTGGVVTATAGNGSSAASGTGGGAACVEKPDGTGGFSQPTCADLGVLTVSDPVITDDGGDGKVEAGEGAILQVNLNEIAGVGFSYYPGVTFTTSAPGVEIVSDNWYYAILPCQVDQPTAHVTIGGGVAPGTVVKITARVGMLNTDCPDAYAIEIPIQVY